MEGVSFDGVGVVGDVLLRRHLQGNRAEGNLDQAVDAERNDQPQPGALQRHQAAEPKENAPLVFVDDPDRRAQADQDDENDNAKDDQRENAHGSLLANALMRRFSSYESRLMS